MNLCSVATLKNIKNKKNDNDTNEKLHNINNFLKLYKINGTNWNHTIKNPENYTIERKTRNTGMKNYI